MRVFITVFIKIANTTGRTTCEIHTTLPKAEITQLYKTEVLYWTLMWKKLCSAHLDILKNIIQWN